MGIAAVMEPESQPSYNWNAAGAAVRRGVWVGGGVVWVGFSGQFWGSFTQKLYIHSYIIISFLKEYFVGTFLGGVVLCNFEQIFLQISFCSNFSPFPFGKRLAHGGAGLFCTKRSVRFVSLRMMNNNEHSIPSAGDYHLDKRHETPSWVVFVIGGFFLNLEMFFIDLF